MILSSQVRSAWVEAASALAPRNCRNDADFVAVLEGGGLVLEEADVLLVHIHVHEAADFALVVEQAVLDAGIFGLHLSDGRADIRGGDGDEFLAAGELTERGGDTDLIAISGLELKFLKDLL